MVERPSLPREVTAGLDKPHPHLVGCPIEHIFGFTRPRAGFAGSKPIAEELHLQIFEAVVGEEQARRARVAKLNLCYRSEYQSVRVYPPKV